MSDVSFQGYATSLVPDAPGYNKNNSYAMAIASSLAYATMDVILDTVAQQWKAIPHYIGRGETQLFCAEFPELVVVAFRGTEPTNFHDWGTDARARLVQNPLGLVHTGFIGSLADIWNDLLQVLAGTDKADAATGRPAKPLWLAGHSLGGAVAELAADRLTAEKLGDVRFLYTYGKPAAGDGGYSAQLAARLQDKLYRIVNNDDLVPRLPPAELGYSHAGRLCYLDSRGKLSFNPDQAFLTKAGLLGMIDNLGKLVPVAVRDHFLAGYLDALKALCGQP